MYRQYRYMPESNRLCCQAASNRSYQAHINALCKITGSGPVVGDTIRGPAPSRTYKARENHRLMAAVQDRRPTLDRSNCFCHMLDHEYQATKHSGFRPTVPMTEILRDEGRTAGSCRRQSVRPDGTESPGLRSGRIAVVAYNHEQQSGRDDLEGSDPG
jgi:hypothetical protein